MKKIFYTLLIVLFLVPVITHAETKKLYDVFKEEAESGSGLVQEYTEEHHDSFTEEGTEKIYHWYGSNDTNANTILDKWNVAFGGFCWQAYRTTDTGGVKLIYNGLPTKVYDKEYMSIEEYETNPKIDTFTFDSNDNTWNYVVDDGKDHKIGFTVPAGDNYNMIITGTTGSSCGIGFTIYKNGNIINGGGGGGGQPINFSYSYGTLTSQDEIKVSISGTSTSSTCSATLKINMQQDIEKIKKSDYSMIVEKDNGKKSCYNSGSAQEIAKIYVGNEENRKPDSSIAYAGYMYNPNNIMNEDYSNTNSGSLYGNDVAYSSGKYTLIDTTTAYDDYHHYTCNNTTGECEQVRYYYFSNNYYTLLSDGKNILNMLEDNLSANDVNQTDSTLKRIIDDWYRNNLIDYSEKIEDTIYCNGRDILDLSGFNPNGGSREQDLKFANWYQNSSGLNCVNITDKFSTNNQFARLTYPIGMLTAPEADLMGNNNMRKTGNNYWLLSADSFGNGGLKTRNVNTDGSHYTSRSTGVMGGGIRPVISVMPGITITGGDGSRSNVYLIKDWDGGDIEIEEQEDGTIEIDNLETILKSTPVVFKVIPKDGFIVDKIIIIDEEGNEIVYDSTGNENEYKFIMPSSNVTIKPIYKEKDIPILPDIINPQTGTLLFFALIVVMLLEIGTYQLIKIKKKRMKEFE
ncbi:MAG: hypothetical protein IJG68_01150 [Bacilli bacterium]|nr:hypothetical protein [Bacilli bacterium]